MTALDNIDKERMEIAAGDYKVDTPVTVSGVADADIAGVDFESLVSQAGATLGLGPDQKPLSPTQIDIQNIDLGATDEDIIQSLDFLDPTKTEEVRSKLEKINEDITTKQARLSLLAGEKDELMGDYQRWGEELTWQRRQAKISEDAGDTTSAKRHSQEADRLAKLIGPREGEKLTSEAAKEFAVSENIAVNPAGFTRKAFEEPGFIGKTFEKLFDVPSKKWAEQTKSVQILQLSNDIKKLVEQKESLSGR